VSNLSIDLRDGVRLARVVQILQAGRAATVTDLTNLRIPAVSRLQKKHNVDLTISQLRVGSKWADCFFCTCPLALKKL
jgi:hypothetical protein